MRTSHFPAAGHAGKRLYPLGMSGLYQLFTVLLVGVGMGSGLTTVMTLSQPSNCQIAAQKACDPDGSSEVSDPAGTQRCIGQQMLQCACD